jgi:hypothetical protein
MPGEEHRLAEFFDATRLAFLPFRPWAICLRGDQRERLAAVGGRQQR